jgi:hypothetical protein
MLAHLHNSRQVDTSLHSDTLSSSNAISIFWQRFELTIYDTQGEHANHYTTDTLIHCITLRIWMFEKLFLFLF